MIVEHFTSNGGWSDSCAHQLDEPTAGQVEQLTITGTSTYSTVAQCARCGEWVTTANKQETLI